MRGGDLDRYLVPYFLNFVFEGKFFALKFDDLLQIGGGMRFFSGDSFFDDLVTPYKFSQVRL